MRKFGLIGFPLGHSFSQKYFTEKFAREGIAGCSYQNYPIETIDRLPQIINDDPEICGLNVTIPYKLEVLKFINYPETEVIEMGAANVLKIKRTAGKVKISGFNSDITGIRDSIVPFISDLRNRALILGTGGSSKAVAYVLKKLGLEIILVSRNKKEGTISYGEISPSLMETTDIIVNTTPSGMFPDISSRPDIDYSLLNERHILFDLVYNPEITLFLKSGQERGCRIITGLTMLHSQAERSWEIWNDISL
jgi:shikimate dehydrogenase